MRSHRSDDIKYLAVDEMNRRRYWRTGDTREDIWRRISRPKLSLFVLANNNKLGIHFNRPHGMHPINLIRFHSHGFFARWWNCTIVKLHVKRTKLALISKHLKACPIERKFQIQEKYKSKVMLLALLLQLYCSSCIACKKNIKGLLTT